MRKLSCPLSAALILLLSGPSFAQWIEHANVEEGFFINFPAEPLVEEITWESEYRATFPARVYSVETNRGRYSVTVVDYREAKRIHTERVAPCVDGSEPCLGPITSSDTGVGIGYWRPDVQGSMVYAASQFLERDAEMTHFAWGLIAFVEGLRLHLTNPDQSRTLASFYLHADRLYILEATTPEGVRGGGLFLQSLQFLDEEGDRIHYKRVYHNSAPPPARMPLPGGL
ncbi:MAG: hypothetical protein E2O65_05580 [Gammaproteobacteria bacterium]|nr:MAG: hypothetical protein E2O65_05580 [Gammaproteobacteria bacterium]